MFSLFNFLSIFPGGSADPICGRPWEGVHFVAFSPGAENPSYATGEANWTNVKYATNSNNNCHLRRGFVACGTVKDKVSAESVINILLF